MDDVSRENVRNRQASPRRLPSRSETTNPQGTSRIAQSPNSVHQFTVPTQNMTSQIPMNDFVTRYFSKRECIGFVENPQTKKCGCNRDKEWHDQNNIPPMQDAEWSSEEHTVLKPTDAFGQIKFNGFGRLPANEYPKYIRVDALLEDFRKIWDLLTGENYWNVPKPEIILSINGGAKKMSGSTMTNRLQVALKKGLMNVVTSARTWFITPGFHVGVGKLVGEAVREYTLAASSDRSFITIGVSTWGSVYNWEELVVNSEDTEDNDCYVAHYTCTDNPRKGEAALNPYHTHFILCDDGSERSFNKEIDFLTKFEDFIAHTATDITGGPPVVQVVIEGGEKTLVTAYAALEKGTPVVVVKGSGRCADVICELLESTKGMTSEESLRKKAEGFLSVFRDNWDTRGQDYEKVTNQLVDISKNYRHLLHIFNINDATKEFDRVILLAVLKSPKLQDVEAQLTLAMNLNLWDLAAREIFSEENKDWMNLNLDELMFKALKTGKTKFVELFLDRGIDIKNFLTADRLEELYCEALKTKNITRDHEKVRDMIENIMIPGSKYDYTADSDNRDLLHIIGIVVRHFTGGAIPNMYLNPTKETHQQSKRAVKGKGHHATPGSRAIPDDHRLHPPQEDQSAVLSTREIRLRSKMSKYPFTKYPPLSPSGERLYTEQDLFIWAVLINRMDLAKVFWRTGKDHIGSALVASTIFRKLQGRASDNGEKALADSLEENSQYFEMIATEILSAAYEEDKDRTHLLLIRSLPCYGNETVLSFAYQNRCMDFMSHTAVQTKLNRIWMGGMNPNVDTWKIWLNIFMFGLGIRLVFPSRYFKLRLNLNSKSTSNPDSRTLPSNKVAPTDGNEQLLNAEYVDEDAPNTRELRETLAAQDASKNMDAKSQMTYIDKFRSRQRHGWKNLRLFKQLHIFYNAPITKFFLNVISSIIFLGLLSYVVTVELKEFAKVGTTNGTCVGGNITGYCIPVVELIVGIWGFTLIIEEIRQVVMLDQLSFLYKIKAWFSSGWNKWDLLLDILFISAIFMRFFLPDPYFVGIRCIYVIILCMYFLRFMQTYYGHPVMGPKVVMIRKMIYDVFFFVIIFLIFLLAYGTAAQALLEPNHELNSQLLKKIFYYPYWHVYDMDLDEVEGTKPGQSKNALVIILFAIYLLLTNVLLLNLLIAMFGYTFSKVQGSSRKIWAYNRYDLILEFSDRSSIPPPFVILPNIYHLFKRLAEMCRLRCCGTPPPNPKSDFKVVLKETENHMLSTFEKHCMEKVMAAKDTEVRQDGNRFAPTEWWKQRKINRRIDTIADKLSVLNEIMEGNPKPDQFHLGKSPNNGQLDLKELHRKVDDNYNDLRERYRNLESMMTKQARALENISFEGKARLRTQ